MTSNVTCSVWIEGATQSRPHSGGARAWTARARDRGWLLTKQSTRSIIWLRGCRSVHSAASLRAGRVVTLSGSATRCRRGLLVAGRERAGSPVGADAAEARNSPGSGRGRAFAFIRKVAGAGSRHGFTAPVPGRGGAEDDRRGMYSRARHCVWSAAVCPPRSTGDRGRISVRAGQRCRGGRELEERDP